MDFLTASDFFNRHLNSAYAAAIPAVILVGAAVKYGPQLMEKQPTETLPKELGEFVFKNGALRPHPEYLYGYSEDGGVYIMGKKVDGHDYSRWEAEYASFAKKESVTYIDSHTKVTWSWTLDTAKAIPLWQLLLGLILVSICALLLIRVARDRKKKGEANKALEQLKAGFASQLAEQQKEMEILAQSLKIQKLCAQSFEISNATLEAENVAANLKIELLEKTVELLERTIELQKKNQAASTAKAATKPRKPNNVLMGNSKARDWEDTDSKVEDSMADAANAEHESSGWATDQEHHASPSNDQTIDIALKNDVSEAQNSAGKEPGPGDEGIETTVEEDEKSPTLDSQLADPELRPDVSKEEDITAKEAELGSENAGSTTEQDDHSPVSKHHIADSEVDDAVSKDEASMAEDPSPSEDLEGAIGQDDRSPALHNEIADPESEDTVSKEDGNTTEPTKSENGDTEGATKQGDDLPAPANPNNGPEEVAVEKPKRLRKNKRADGTVRTATHPDFVPRAPNPPRPQPDVPAPLGDRPFIPVGRGNGYGGQVGSPRGGAGNVGRGRGGGIIGGAGLGGRGGGGYEMYRRGRGW